MSRARKAMQERVALYNRAIFEAAQESAASVFALVLDKAVARNMFHVAACVLQSSVSSHLAPMNLGLCLCHTSIPLTKMAIPGT